MLVKGGPGVTAVLGLTVDKMYYTPCLRGLLLLCFLSFVASRLAICQCCFTGTGTVVYYAVIIEVPVKLRLGMWVN